VLGLEPQIDVQASLESVVNSLKEASVLVEPEDDLTAETREVLDSLSNGVEEVSVKEEGTSGRVFGSRKELISIIDRVAADGGSWEEITEKVKVVATMVGFRPSTFRMLQPSWIRSHLERRIKQGWIDAGMFEYLDILLTSKGITVTKAEKE